MRRFFVCFVFSICVFPAMGQSGIPLASFENIPDSAKLRKGIADLWLLAEPDLVAQLKTSDYTDGTGRRFSVESRVIGEILEVQITPYDTTFLGAGMVISTSSSKSSTASLQSAPTTGAKSETSNSEPAEASSAVSRATTATTEPSATTSPQNEEDAEATRLVQTQAPISSKRNVPQGTWILQRHAQTGAPISITIYLRESSDLFIVLKPSSLQRLKDKSLIDFCLYSAYVRRDVPISFSFETLYYTSLVELKNKTAQILPWHIFNPPQQYSSVETTSKAVLKNLTSLVYLDDGAFDENGRACYISTGAPQTKDEILKAADSEDVESGTKLKGGVNGFGFVKWIVDGIIKPVAGSGTYIDSLKRPTDIPATDFNAAYLEKRSLFFGLDWIRNLAAARLSLTMKKTVYPQTGGLDVTIEPFSFSLPVQSDGAVQKKFAGYFKSVGYQIEYLQPLLYYLAVTEPGYFYLGSLSHEGGEPSLRQHSQTLAIFPYFDILGTFKVDIYENAKLVSLDDFIQKNANSFIALVRLRAPEAGFFRP